MAQEVFSDPPSAILTIKEKDQRSEIAQESGLFILEKLHNE